MQLYDSYENKKTKELYENIYHCIMYHISCVRMKDYISFLIIEKVSEIFNYPILEVSFEFMDNINSCVAASMVILRNICISYVSKNKSAKIDLEKTINSIENIMMKTLCPVCDEDGLSDGDI